MHYINRIKTFLSLRRPKYICQTIACYDEIGQKIGSDFCLSRSTLMIPTEKHRYNHLGKPRLS